MKHWMSLAISLTFACLAWAQPRPVDVLKEELYQGFKEKIISKNWVGLGTGLTEFEQKYFVDAVWDLTDEGMVEVIGVFNDVNTFHYSIEERLRIEILKLKLKKISKLPDPLVTELTRTLNDDSSVRLNTLILSYEEELTEGGGRDLVELSRSKSTNKELLEGFIDQGLSTAPFTEVPYKVVQDLVYRTPDLSVLMEGEYAQSVKIFLFCRFNRKYPCLMIMKDIQGNIVRNADGTIWIHRALSSSTHDIPSYKYNGNTPAGVHTIDSVMPLADLPLSFGKNRRMILNFVPKSPSEDLLKSFLPPSSHKESWWKNSVIARNVGRDNLRIHGTGKRNTNPSTPYFPFMRTLGCVAQREGTYNGITYNDQRVLLNTIMFYMGLTPSFDNETSIKGVLYVMELDRKEASVKLSDLQLRGIK
jgi:hypothetical protein